MHVGIHVDMRIGMGMNMPIRLRMGMRMGMCMGTFSHSVSVRILSTLVTRHAMLTSDPPGHIY